MEINDIIAKLPKHLMQYVLDQDYSQYSPIDQAVWRHVMKKNVAYLPKVAHESYVSGLELAGISTEEIPTMYGMNRILQDIGWAAVAVDGFIPTSAFLEFQAYKVLVIAQDIRQLENISYTPAPDIIHESAGHAPIIANAEYSEYLRRMGEIGCRAIPSAEDQALYEATRSLAIIKEASGSDTKKIAEAQEKVDYLQQNMGPLSEMARLRNLHWWTVEYGLIGSLDKPKIYGAGLLSSIGESISCLKPEVTKLPYTLTAADVSFDVTRPQPQLFVTPDFAHLSFVLEEFANQMSIRKGGAKGIERLIDSKQMGTVTYNTGLQVSGVFTEIIKDDQGMPIYIKTSGPTALSYHEKELIGHGTNYHAHGFGSPVGKLQNINIPIERMSPFDLEAYKIKEGKHTTLKFEGGIEVSGEVITGVRTVMGEIILISFKNCTVKYHEEILFRPEWGVFDMAVGSEIVSAFAGAADLNSFEVVPQKETEVKTESVTKSAERLELEGLYAEVREMRNANKINRERLIEISNELEQKYPEDVLLKQEIAEF
jgi:phenylalanine-4-hydroxylase